MGMMKHLMDEWESQGWSPVDKFVCDLCVDDESLKRVIAASLTQSSCDYCDPQPPNERPAAPVDCVLAAVVQGLNTEYEDPVKQVGWQSAEGGYLIPPTDTYELLWGLEISSSEDLLSDLTDAIITPHWVQRDPYAASEIQQLLWGWEAFQNAVRTKRRYTFLTDVPADVFEEHLPIREVPAAILGAIEGDGRLVTQSSDRLLTRIRVHDANQDCGHARDIGTPPAPNAKPNRMTAHGIAVFYGADLIDGAIAEVKGYVGDEHGTAGTFKPTRDLRLIDLVTPPTLPSLFDERRRHLRPSRSLLAGFIRDAARPVAVDDVPDIHYVPTQIVTEFLRYEFTIDGRQELPDGLMWRSVADPGAISYALFVARDDCIDEDEPVNGDRLQLVLQAESVQPLGRLADL